MKYKGQLRRVLGMCGMFTWENTWKEIEDAKVRIAVVPIGSTEQHGTNLPLSTDTLITALEDIRKQFRSMPSAGG